MSRDHQQLVNDALAGKAEAVQALVALLTPVVQARVARALLQRGPTTGRAVRQEVEDVTQEVFLSLFEHDGKGLRAWQPERGLSLKNFVGLMAQRQTISILRSGKRSPWRDEPADLQRIDALAEPQQHQEGRIASRELLARLLQRLRESLSPQGLELFYRLLVHDEPVETVCQQTGMTASAVYAWRSRLGKLARRLADEIEDDTEKATDTMSDRGDMPRMPTVQSNP